MNQSVAIALDPSVSELLGTFLANAAERVAATFFGQVNQGIQQLRLPRKVQRAKENPRLIAAQLHYLQQKVRRDQELRSLQAHLPSQTAELSPPASPLQTRYQQLQIADLQERRQVSQIQRQVIHELQSQEIQGKLTEIQSIWDRGSNWPSTLSREETEKILLDERTNPRLLMLVSPPDISEDCPESFRNNLEKDIRNGLKGFMAEYYPLESGFNPVEFYGKYFNRSIFDVEVKQLEALLAPVPTAILYSDISDYEVHFHVGFWGMQDNTVSLLLIQPWNWEAVKESLEGSGKDEKQSLRLVRQLIVAIHKLLAAFLADLYYLSIDCYYEPRLFSLADEFHSEVFATTWNQTYIQLLHNIQQQQQQALEQELRPFLEQSVASLPATENPPLATLPTPPIVDSSTLPASSGQPESPPTDPGQIKQQRQRASLTHQSRTEFLAKLQTAFWRHQQTLTGHQHPVMAIGITPDAQAVWSVASEPTHPIKLWKLASGQLLQSFSSPLDAIDAIALSAQRHIVALGGSEIAVLNFKTQKQQRFPGNSPIALSADGRLLASSHLRYETNGFCHWVEVRNLATGDCQALAHQSDYFRTLALSPDQQFLASSNDQQTVNVWHLPTGQLAYTITQHAAPVSVLTFSPDSQWLASGSDDATIYVWHLRDGSLTATLQHHQAAIAALAFSADSQLLASGSWDYSIKLWLPQSGELLRSLHEHSGAVSALHFSRDSRILVSGSHDHTIKVWQWDW